MKIKTFIIAGIITLGATLGFATTAHADTHTVVAGESLWSIGQAYGETPEQIVLGNPSKISSINSIILPGESLEVGKASETPSAYQNSSETQFTTSSSSDGNSSTGSDNSNTAEKAAQLMAEKTGVSASEWETIIQRESNGEVSAQNSSSSAHGLFQVLGETSNNWETQVDNAASLYKSQGLGAWSETAY